MSKTAQKNGGDSGAPAADSSQSLYDDLEMLCTTIAVSASSGDRVQIAFMNPTGLIECQQMFTTLMARTLSAASSLLTGDVLTMTARALHLFVEHVRPCILFAAGISGSPSRKKMSLDNSEVGRYFAFLFHTCLSSPNTVKRESFTRCTFYDLVEEVLKCLSVARSVEGIDLPPMGLQLQFCLPYISEGDSDKEVISFVVGLLRASPRLSHHEKHEYIPGIVEALHIVDEKLKVTPLDRRWCDLLCGLTECLLTLSTRCAITPAPSDGGVSKNTSANSSSVTQTVRNKRNRRLGDDAHSQASPTSSMPASPLLGTETLRPFVQDYAMFTLRALRERPPQRILAVALACCTSVMEVYFRSSSGSVTPASSSVETPPQLIPLDDETRTALFEAVAAVLRAKTEKTCTFDDPFTARLGESSGGRPRPAASHAARVAAAAQGGTAQTERGEDFGDDVDSAADDAEEAEELSGELLKPLHSLDWIVPSLEWSAMLMLSYVLGVVPQLSAEYVWGATADDGSHYWIRRAERLRLTEAFFSGGDRVRMDFGQHVNLRRMTFEQDGTPLEQAVHFQAVPHRCSLVDSARFLLQLPSYPLHSLSDEALTTLLEEVLRHSYTPSAVGPLAAVLLLNCVRLVGPRIPSVAVAAVSRLVMQHPELLVLVHLTRTALQGTPSNDGAAASTRAWCTILGEAGVPDALVAAARAKVVDRPPPTGCGATSSKQISAAALPAPEAALVEEAQRLARRIHKHTRSSPPPSPELVARRGRRLESAGGAPGGDRHAADNGGLAAFLGQLSESEMQTYFAEHAITPFAVLWPQDDPTTLAAQLDASLQRRVRTALTFFVLLTCRTVVTVEGSPDLATGPASDAPVRLQLCSADGGASTAESSALLCRSGHPLVVSAATNWTCNECRKSSAYNALRCHLCDYDLCKACADGRRVLVHWTAQVSDVCREVERRREKESKGTVAAGRGASHMVLFQAEASHTIPPTAPAFAYVRNPVHAATAHGRCACGLACPDSPPVDDARLTSARHTLLYHLLRACGCDHLVQPALEEAVRSSAANAFVSGPLTMRDILLAALQGLQPHLELDFKKRLAYFLTVGTRRFGLYYLQDRNIALRGNVVGDVHSNGLPVKVTVARDDPASNVPVLEELFGRHLSQRARVEFYFAGEEGFGTGPTQELYSVMSSFFADTRDMWFTKDDGVTVGFPSAKLLFISHFFVLGALCGRAFADHFVFRAPLDPLVWVCARALPRPPLWETAEQLEPALAKSLRALESYSADELAALELEDEESGEPLTRDTIHAFTQAKLERHFEIAIENLHAFLRGIATAVDCRAFFVMSPEDICTVVCHNGSANGDPNAPLFTADELRQCIEEAHGYTAGCDTSEMFITLVGDEFSRDEQQLFVEFLTGSTQLPLGGLAGLGRKIVLAKKDFESHGDQMLPSCSTCFLYFKLPPYKNKETMRARLLTAFRDGRKSFSLS